MFVINDDLSIYITRGDVLALTVSAEIDGEPYSFSEGDVLRFKVFAKKNCEDVVLERDFIVENETGAVEIFLTRRNTKIGGVISKPTDYWYEIELNPDTNPRTIVGYDEDGAKLFRLYPEGGDKDADQDEDMPSSGESSGGSGSAGTGITVSFAKIGQTIVVEELDEKGNPVLFRGVDLPSNGEDGEDGTTFTPSVDADGNLSWTNDGGKQNPAVVNIKGKDGDKGDPGYTPVKGTDYYTDEEKAEMVTAVRESIPTVLELNLKGFSTGPWFEKLSDGRTVNHMNTFDANGIITAIDGMKVVLMEEAAE